MGKPYLYLGKCLALAYLLTGAAILILALVLYKTGLTEKMVSGAMIFVYGGVNFLAGFLAGKKLKNRKFLWGFLLGTAYFLILFIISLTVKKDISDFGSGVLTTYVLCAGGGMLGGMLG